MRSRRDSCFTHDFMSEKRYQYSCLHYGFTFVLDNVLPNSQRFLCTGCMKPSSLKEHLQTLHPLNLKTQKLYLKSSEPDWKQEAHFPVMNILPGKLAWNKDRQRKKKQHTISKILVKPCTMEVAQLMYQAMSFMIEWSTSQKISAGKWWSKYREGARNLFAVGWINWCFRLVSTSHFCSVCASESHRRLSLLWTSERNIMGMVNEFLDSCSLSWDLVVLPLCWEKFRIYGCRQKMNLNMISSHCILHRHALALKTLVICETRWILPPRISICTEQGHWFTPCSKSCAKRVSPNTPYFFCVMQKHAGYEEKFWHGFFNFET
jgi:hypothetical protein